MARGVGMRGKKTSGAREREDWQAERGGEESECSFPIRPHRCLGSPKQGMSSLWVSNFPH